MQDSQSVRENLYPVGMHLPHILCTSPLTEKKVSNLVFVLEMLMFSGGDKVGHRSLQYYNVKVENRGLTAGPLPIQDALSGQPGWRLAGLEY